MFCGKSDDEENSLIYFVVMTKFADKQLKDWWKISIWLEEKHIPFNWKELLQMDFFFFDAENSFAHFWLKVKFNTEQKHSSAHMEKCVARCTTSELIVKPWWKFSIQKRKQTILNFRYYKYLNWCEYFQVLYNKHTIYEATLILEAIADELFLKHNWKLKVQRKTFSLLEKN